MTLEAIIEAIKRLIIKRAESHGKPEEQARINAKLDKLYVIKATMLEQMGGAV